MSAASAAPGCGPGWAVLAGWWRRRGYWENAAISRQRREVGLWLNRGRVPSLLRGLRREARLTQEELAEAAGLSVRAVRYLERGVVSTPQRETVRLLANALGLVSQVRAGFEAAARGPAAAGRRVAAATRALPRDIASFTGRDRSCAASRRPRRAGGVVGIHAIGGMAGIGKTAFAVHAAHQLAPRFPDGQIFLPLHGHTPGQPPVDPADALASLLQIAGVAPPADPAGPRSADGAVARPPGRQAAAADPR